MLRINFTPETIERLAYERHHHPHPRVQLKMEVLYLKALGYPHREIRRVSGVCENTLLKYLRAYQAGGLEALREIRFRRPCSELSAHRLTLEAYFRAHPPASVKAAAAKIKELTGIQRSPERVRVYLKQLGMKRRKVGMVPAKADAQVQAQFQQEQLEPRLKEARSGRRAIFL